MLIEDNIMSYHFSANAGSVYGLQHFVGGSQSILPVFHDSYCFHHQAEAYTQRLLLIYIVQIDWSMESASCVSLSDSR
jgi:hypothetical protein